MNIRNRRIHLPVLVVLFSAALAAVSFNLLSQSEASNSDRADGNWRVLPIRSEEEFDAGLYGGEGEQNQTAFARSPADPSRIYVGHDVGQLWRSDDNGVHWKHLRMEGYNTFGTISIAADPVNPDVVFAMGDTVFDQNSEDWNGLYRSTDGGDTWEFIKRFSVDTRWPKNNVSRETQQNIVYDPTSIDSNGAKRWYTAVDCGRSSTARNFTTSGAPGGGACDLYISNDYGVTWTTQSDLGRFNHIHMLETHPTDGNTILMASDTGLHRSTNRGASFTKIGSGLPASMDVNWATRDPNDPSIVYASLFDSGLYKSTDNGDNFTKLRDGANRYIVVHPNASPTILYMMGDVNNGVSGLDFRTYVSHDAGANWILPSVTGPNGFGREDRDYFKRVRGDQVGVSPNPVDPNDAVVFASGQFLRTLDKGANWKASNELYTGWNWSVNKSAAYFDPDNRDNMYFFNQDIGMSYSNNGATFFEHGSSLRSFKEAGLIDHTTTVSGGVQPGSNGQVIITAAGFSLRSKIIRSTDGGNSWSVVSSDNGQHRFVKFHPDRPNIAYAGYKVSTDGGANWTAQTTLTANKAEIVDFTASNPDVVWAMDFKNTANGGGNGEYCKNHVGTDTGDAGRKIYRSTNAGASWQLFTETSWPMACASSPKFAAHPTDTNVFYSVDQNGDIARYDKSNDSWTSLDLFGKSGGAAKGDIPLNYVQNILVDQNDPDIIYAHMSEPGGTQLWRTSDAGQSWTDVTENLPRTNNAAVALHPITGDVFLGSPIGTWIYPAPYAVAGQPSFAETAGVHYSDVGSSDEAVPIYLDVDILFEQQ